MEELESAVNVRYPEMRTQVFSAVSALADREYQQRVWIDQIYPHENYYDDLDLNIHILYDDALVLPDPTATLGQVLANRTEVDTLRLLAERLDPIIDELGDSPDSGYLSHPGWPSVVDAAKSAREVMRSTGDL
ncbi:SCO4402 family protein [Nocardia fusca]|uniref:CdiI immunity protein domain-containing protein n=1 Tax=Nocardia fusca TaxID=941183 RepID=A0ABV3FF24_9NOCA